MAENIISALLYPLTFTISHLLDRVPDPLTPEMVALLSGPKD